MKTTNGCPLSKFVSWNQLPCTSNGQTAVRGSHFLDVGAYATTVHKKEPK